MTTPLDARTLLAVAAGGVAGALARYGLGFLVPVGAGGFPLATFLVNTSGCLALGVLLAVLPREGLLRAFATSGVVASYTTFSALAVQAVLLAREGHAGVALLYLAATVLAGVAATVFGLAAGRAVAR